MLTRPCISAGTSPAAATHRADVAVEMRWASNLHACSASKRRTELATKSLAACTPAMLTM